MNKRSFLVEISILGHEIISELLDYPLRCHGRKLSTYLLNGLDKVRLIGQTAYANVIDKAFRIRTE